VVTQLVNETAERLGHRVESTGVIGPFEIDKDTIISLRLPTCPESQGVVTDCFDTRYARAIMGSPGTGKSWNMRYALQQALLYDNSLTLNICKSDMVLLFPAQRQDLCVEKYL
jgi:hypothetical protein